MRAIVAISLFSRMTAFLRCILSLIGLPVRWPQACDELLEDMGLKGGRSGGNWFTWPFKVISMKELETVGKERRAKRSSVGM
jgi:hypothetical protein